MELQSNRDGTAGGISSDSGSAHDSSTFPSAPLPACYLSLATAAECVERDAVMFTHWGDGWTADGFMNREAALGAHVWGQHHKQYFVLKALMPPAGQTPIVASTVFDSKCDESSTCTAEMGAYRVVANAEVYAVHSVVDGVHGCSYILTSVFVDTCARKMGWGTTLITQIIAALETQVPPPPFRGCAVHAAVLFSEIGAKYYRRLGFVPPTTSLRTIEISRELAHMPLAGDLPVERYSPLAVTLSDAVTSPLHTTPSTIGACTLPASVPAWQAIALYDPLLPELIGYLEPYCNHGLATVSEMTDGSASVPLPGTTPPLPQVPHTLQTATTIAQLGFHCLYAEHEARAVGSVLLDGHGLLLLSSDKSTSLSGRAEGLIVWKPSYDTNQLRVLTLRARSTAALNRLIAAGADAASRLGLATLSIRLPSTQCMPLEESTLTPATEHHTPSDATSTATDAAPPACMRVRVDVAQVPALYRELISRPCVSIAASEYIPMYRPLKHVSGTSPATIEHWSFLEEVNWN